jgi:hypothetical protein
MSYHDFRFTPINHHSGWYIHNDGDPSIWWKARLDHSHPVLLTDKTDLRHQEVQVKIVIGTETPIGKTPYTGGDVPEAKWGGLIYQEDADYLRVFIAVSRENFDRILASVRDACPPTVTVGFGPDGAFDELEGPITEDEATGGYYWDNAKESSIPIESCDFGYSHALIDTDVPELDEKIPGTFGTVMRGFGVGFSVAGNLIAILVALAMFSAASTKFETATVSLLVFIYLAIVRIGRELPRMLARIELSQLARYFTLRTLVGAATEKQEAKYLAQAQEGIGKPGSKYWVNLAGDLVIGVIAGYRLFMLLL